MAEGSQTFEQDIARLVLSGKVDKKEGVANADSPTNLMWRLQNDFTKASQAQKPAENTDDTPTFTEFTIDVQR
jgi:twitching motility protein PilU